MLTGCFSTLLIKETKQQSLEDLSNEKQEGFIEREYRYSSARSRCPDAHRDAPGGPAKPTTV